MRWLIATMLAACGAGGAAPAAAPANHAATAAPAPAPAPPAGADPDRRCLPVVAADCGCVYGCAAGVRAGDAWTVTHPFWGDQPLTARIDRFCVGGACTVAFHATLVCDALCAPRPADATCHFDDRGACVGAA